MGRTKSYIPAPDYIKHRLPIPEFSFKEKIPIAKIKVDLRLLAGRNLVYWYHVEDILENFLEDAWEPIVVNEDFFLLDGQHRLQVAKKMKLKYIDVEIHHSPSYSSYYDADVKSIAEGEELRHRQGLPPSPDIGNKWGSIVDKSPRPKL